jgi:hypothetical protein
VEWRASTAAEGQAFKYAEKLKVITPRMLHAFTDTWKY